MKNYKHTFKLLTLKTKMQRKNKTYKRELNFIFIFLNNRQKLKYEINDLKLLSFYLSHVSYNNCLKEEL